MGPFVLVALSAMLAHRVLATPTPASSAHPQSTAVPAQEDPEHIIILDGSSPHPHDILDRIGLYKDHLNVRHIYNNAAFRGFAARVPNDTVYALGFMTDVTHVEATVAVMSTRQKNSAKSTRPPHHHSRSKTRHSHPNMQKRQADGDPQQSKDDDASSTTASIRPHSPWGLQRISSTASLVSAPKTFLQSLAYTFAYPPTSPLGLNVDIYSIDSGINLEAAAFTSRASQGWSYSPDSTDYDGHGTHTAATAAGDTFGIATAANIIGVKVLDANGSGSSADTIAGMDYVINQHMKHKAANTNSGNRGGGFVASVMSMSWGLSKRSSAIDKAIEAASNVGIHITVAAGNSHGTDACTVSPSSLGGVNSAVISVGSVGATNEISDFSNVGPCVDVYAPGEEIVSAWRGGKTVANVLSGTSMAAPHVTGLVACLASESAEMAGSVGGMKGRVLSLTRTGVVAGDAKGGPSVLVNNGVTGGVDKRDQDMDGLKAEDTGDVEKREDIGWGDYTLVDEGTNIH